MWKKDKGKRDREKENEKKKTKGKAKREKKKRNEGECMRETEGKETMREEKKKKRGGGGGGGGGGVGGGGRHFPSRSQVNRWLKCVGARNKVGPSDESYAWVPETTGFVTFQNVGVFPTLFISCLVAM